MSVYARTLSRSTMESRTASVKSRFAYVVAPTPKAYFWWRIGAVMNTLGKRKSRVRAEPAGVSTERKSPSSVNDPAPVSSGPSDAGLSCDCGSNRPRLPPVPMAAAE